MLCARTHRKKSSSNFPQLYLFKTWILHWRERCTAAGYKIKLSNELITASLCFLFAPLWMKSISCSKHAALHTHTHNSFSSARKFDLVVSKRTRNNFYAEISIETARDKTCTIPETKGAWREQRREKDMGAHCGWGLRLFSHAYHLSGVNLKLLNFLRPFPVVLRSPFFVLCACVCE